MKTWVYSWIIYPVVYAIASMWGVFNTKVRETLRLRSWKDFLSLRFNVGQPIEYWVHVASHGELEYALPILHELDRLGKRVLVTYYSISAKKPVEQLPGFLKNVSLVVPLPHDGLGLMKEFVKLVHKQGVRHLLLLKYELWPGVLWECNRQGIRVLLVDAIRPSWFHRKLLHKLDGIFSGYQTEVQGIVHPQVLVVGDTRVERVVDRMQSSEGKLTQIVHPNVKTLLQRKPVLVCGSMWPKDSELVFDALRDLKKNENPFHVIWVPHELELRQEKQARQALLTLGYHVHSLSDNVDLSVKDLAIIVMQKGVLTELYRLGKFAFVGGGFGRGVHSVWEPAIAGCRVACGPGTERSPEVAELQKQGRLIRVQRAREFAEWIRLGFEQHDQSIEPVLAQHMGAAKRIIQHCERI